MVVDVETTGLHPSEDRIVTFAAIELLDRVATGKGHHLIFNPGRPSHPRAYEAHRLPDCLLSAQTPFADWAQCIRDFLGDAILVAHNLRFDLSFLEAEFARAGQPPISRVPNHYCTLEAWQQRMNTRRGKLKDVAAHFGLAVDGPLHQAATDASLTMGVFQALFGLIPQGVSMPAPINLMWPKLDGTGNEPAVAAVEALDVEGANRMELTEIRMRLACRDYVYTLAARTKANETREQLNALIRELLADSTTYEPILSWAERTWHHSPRRVPKDSLRQRCEQRLGALA